MRSKRCGAPTLSFSGDLSLARERSLSPPTFFLSPVGMQRQDSIKRSLFILSLLTLTQEGAAAGAAAIRIRRVMCSSVPWTQSLMWRVREPYHGTLEYEGSALLSSVCYVCSIVVVVVEVVEVAGMGLCFREVLYSSCFFFFSETLIPRNTRCIDRLAEKGLAIVHDHQ
jgi:hypothetical protein